MALKLEELLKPKGKEPAEARLSLACKPFLELLAGAFHHILTTATFRIALSKRNDDRKQADHRLLAKQLQSYLTAAFGPDSCSKMEEQDYKEVVNCMSFKQWFEGETIYTLGEHPKYLFVLLRGLVTIQRKNTKLDRWDWARSVLMGLREWKEQEIDGRLIKAMERVDNKGKNAKGDDQDDDDDDYEDEYDDENEEEQDEMASKLKLDEPSITVFQDIKKKIQNKYLEQRTIVERKKKQKNIKLLEDLKMPVSKQIRKWKHIKITHDTNLHEYVQFECEQFLKLTDKEKCLLHQLHHLEQLEWFEDVNDVKVGECFGQVPFDDLQNYKNLPPYANTVLVKEHAGLAVISLKDLNQIFKDAEARYI